MATSDTAIHRWHIAQINVGRVRAPLTDPIMARFVAQLEAINELAERSDGFVWRLKDDNGASSSYVRFDEDERLLVNMSVWRSIEALHTYAYRSDHGRVLADRREWFEPLAAPALALWWIPAGEIPSVDEGRRRWQCLRDRGPTTEAFTFKQRFPPPDGVNR